MFLRRDSGVQRTPDVRLQDARVGCRRCGSDPGPQLTTLTAGRAAQSDHAQGPANHCAMADSLESPPATARSSGKIEADTLCSSRLLKLAGRA